MENISAAHRRVIGRRLRSGEKALRIARENALTLDQVIRIANETGVALRRGPPKICNKPELYRQHVNAVYGPGTADKVLRLRSRLTYADIGKELGGMSRGSVYHIDHCLTGGAPKPAVPRKPWPHRRRDVTVEKVRQLARRCTSSTAIARALHAHRGVICRRAEEGGFDLPNGAPHNWRPDITREKLIRMAKKLPSCTALARALKTDPATIRRRAKRYGMFMFLLAHKLARRERRERLCERIRELAEVRRGATFISAELKICRTTVYKYNRIFCLGIPIAPRPKRAA